MNFFGIWKGACQKNFKNHCTSLTHVHTLMLRTAVFSCSPLGSSGGFFWEPSALACCWGRQEQFPIVILILSHSLFAFRSFQSRDNIKWQREHVCQCCILRPANSCSTNTLDGSNVPLKTHVYHSLSNRKVLLSDVWDYVWSFSLVW